MDRALEERTATLQHAPVQPPRDPHPEAADSVGQTAIICLGQEMDMIRLNRIVDDPKGVGLGIANAANDFVVKKRNSQIRQSCHSP